jgi:signal transduction histidine kinase
MSLKTQILVVDDTPLNVKLLRDVLEAEGYVVVTASSGADALQVIEKDPPALVLLDVVMPGMSGYEVCQKIRENTDTALLPVVMVTALDPAHERVKGLEAGADDFITKPINRPELLARVRSLLRIKVLHDMVKAQAVELAEALHALGDIGHDIKNLLQPVVSATSLLQTELNELFGGLPALQQSKPEASHELCNEVLAMLRDTVRRIQDRMREIANCVKGLSSPPQFAPCKVVEMVDSVVKTLHMHAEGKNLVLRTEGLDALPQILADESRLYNAFYNLINNAIPETPPGGFVIVRGKLKADGKAVLVEVADSGRGMPPEVRDSLFTARAISRKPGGTGLGTKIIKDVVRAHNGAISVQSEEGKGTIFFIELPMRPDLPSA